MKSFPLVKEKKPEVMSWFTGKRNFEKNGASSGPLPEPGYREGNIPSTVPTGLRGGPDLPSQWRDGEDTGLVLSPPHLSFLGDNSKTVHPPTPGGGPLTLGMRVRNLSNSNHQCRGLNVCLLDPGLGSNGEPVY